MSAEKLISTPATSQTTDAANQTANLIAQAQGKINAALATADLTALQGILSDPDILAVAQTDAGSAVLLGFVNGTITVKQTEALLISGKANPDALASELVSLNDKNNNAANDILSKIVVPTQQSNVSTALANATAETATAVATTSEGAATAVAGVTEQGAAAIAGITQLSLVPQGPFSLKELEKAQKATEPQLALSA